RTGGKLASAGRMLADLVQQRPDACYVLDMAASGVMAAGVYKHMTGTPFAVDTGDAIVDLGRVMGRSAWGILATRALETYGMRAADAVVVRGSRHRDWLAKQGVRAQFVPDGVDLDQFADQSPDSKIDPSFEKSIVLGLIGSSMWIPSRQTCYGWE